MKKVAFMIVYNDADYVGQAIESVKDWVDEMIVVEGAFEITMKTGKPARSNDGTLEILSKYVDNEKVFLKQVNLQEHKDHYDIGYQWAIERGADWAILVDSDEVWTQQAKTMADMLMKAQAKHSAFEIRVSEYCFINDFWHWYQGAYPRIFKATPGSKFVYDNEVQFANHHRGQHPVLMMQGRNIFHYGYVRRKKRWEMKQEYMWEKDQNPVIKTQYGLEGNTYVIPKDLPIFKFTGKHPEVMRDHPFHSMTAEEIIHG